MTAPATGRSPSHTPERADWPAPPRTCATSSTSKRFIAAGIPLGAQHFVARRRAARARRSSAPTGTSLVVRGFDAHGDVIVNDPAQPAVRHVYPRAAFERCWLDHGGVALLVAPAERHRRSAARARTRDAQPEGARRRRAPTSPTPRCTSCSSNRRSRPTPATSRACAPRPAARCTWSSRWASASTTARSSAPDSTTGTRSGWSCTRRSTHFSRPFRPNAAGGSRRPARTPYARRGVRARRRAGLRQRNGRAAAGAARRTSRAHVTHPDARRRRAQHQPLDRRRHRDLRGARRARFSRAGLGRRRETRRRRRRPRR